MSLPSSKVTLLNLAKTPAIPPFTKVFEPVLNSISPVPLEVVLSKPIPAPALSIRVFPSVLNFLATVTPLKRTPLPSLLL